jgi:hypothetical protein
MGTGICYLCLCWYFYHATGTHEAKQRTPTHPLTSFDQKLSIVASLGITFALGVPFIWIGYAFL